MLLIFISGQNFFNCNSKAWFPFSCNCREQIIFTDEKQSRCKFVFISVFKSVIVDCTQIEIFYRISQLDTFTTLTTKWKPGLSDLFYPPKRYIQRLRNVYLILKLEGAICQQQRPCRSIEFLLLFSLYVLFSISCTKPKPKRKQVTHVKIFNNDMHSGEYKRWIQE